MEKLVIGINSGFDSTKVCVDGKETCFETVLSEYQEGIFSLARNRGIHLQDSAGENLVVGREALQYGKNLSIRKIINGLAAPIFSIFSAPRYLKPLSKIETPVS